VQVRTSRLFRTVAKMISSCYVSIIIGIAYVGGGRGKDFDVFPSREAAREAFKRLMTTGDQLKVLGTAFGTYVRLDSCCSVSTVAIHDQQHAFEAYHGG